MKLGNIEIKVIETLFRQQSDSSSKAMIRFQDFLLDDLRQTNATHIISRYITIDSNPHMIILDYEYKPSNCKSLVNVQVESVYICINLDYLNILKHFFISDFLTYYQNSIETEKRSSSVETTIDIILKNPEIVLLEDQQDSNSNSLILNVNFLSLSVRMLPYGNIELIFCKNFTYSNGLSFFNNSIIMCRHFSTDSCVQNRTKAFATKINKVLHDAPKKHPNRKNDFLTPPNIQW